MILKNLFFKLQKEDLKRRIWTLALIIIGMLFILPIQCAIRVDRYYDNNFLDHLKIVNYLIKFMGPANFLLTAFTVISAIVSGLSGFYYLQSRKKIDLYHSIPVKRETLFSTGFLNGILIYAIPYVINILICFIILWLKHFMCMEIFHAALLAFGIHMLYYCLIYTVTIIAVMMTGNIIISFLGSMVFLLYGSMWIEIWGKYSTSFFKTYYSMGRGEANKFSSPLLSYISVISDIQEKSDYRYLIMISIVELIIFIALAVILYKKRPSEAAGNAIAFNISKPIIKILLVIPIALGGGIILWGIVTGNQDGWFIFGLIFTLLITNGIIQVIYNFDIRSAFLEVKQLLVCIIATGLIACIFRFDILRFDTYIPKMNDVKSMSVSISGIDEQQSSHISETISNRYISNDVYQLQNMKMTDFAAAYSLAKVGIETRNNTNLGKKYYDFAMDGYYDYVVKYTLKNGKNVYRRYRIADNMSTDLLEKIYNNEEFKEAHYSINDIQAKDISEISVNYVSELLNYTKSGKDGNSNIYFNNKSGREDIEELVKIYRNDMNHLTFKEASEIIPVAALNITIDNISSHGNYIYPSFTKTLAFLKDHGFDVTKTVDLNRISEIIVTKNANNQYAMDASKENLTANEQNMISYKDADKIKEILPTLVSSNVYQNNSTISKIDNNIEVIISYKDTGESFIYYFLPGSMPEFVKNDLEHLDQ